MTVRKGVAKVVEKQEVPAEVAVPAAEVAAEVVQPTSGAVVLDPTVLNPQSMQPPPHVGVKLVWDNPGQDPNARKHIGEDPTGEKNAAKFQPSD